MYKKLFIITALVLLTSSLFAQAGGITPLVDRKGKPAHYSQTRPLTSDSADFYSSFIFHIPAGVRADSVQLLIYTLSSDGAVDVDITSMWGFNKAGSRSRAIGDYAWYPDSTAIVTAHSTESAEGYLIVHAAKDTLVNGVSGIMPYADAVRINVKGGGASNRADTDFWLQMMGIVDTDK